MKTADSDRKGPSYAVEMERRAWGESHAPGDKRKGETYWQSMEKLKSYMQRQWSLVGGMTGTFRKMGNRYSP